MAIADSWYELLEEEASLQHKEEKLHTRADHINLRNWESTYCKYLALTETSSLADSLKKFSTSCVLHHYS